MAGTPPADNDRSSMALLGSELQSNAARVAGAVLAWWLQNRPEQQPPDSQICDDILRTVELGTMATGRFLVTGSLPSSSEREALAAPGTNAMNGLIGVDDLTKLYLVTRDVTFVELAAYALRLGVDVEVLKAAQRVVQVGSDSAIVGVVRSFDAARRHLQDQLDAERGLLAHQALHDALTGLPNRTLLMDRLERLLAGSGPAARREERRRPNFAVLFIDVDRFKAVNDVAGHRVGDELLIAVAARLRAVTRGHDTLARLGGDEFVIICPELADPLGDASAVAERITASVAQPFRLGGSDAFYVTASVGVGVAAAGDCAESVLSRADAAMYAAKRRGGSGYQVYDESADPTLRRRPQLINDLHLAAESGQMSLHYQPVMHLGTDRIRCMEALARWSHPRFGSVRPDEFIPLAEETGVIVALGRWVIGQALADCAGWQKACWPGVGVSVNVSGRQLTDEGLADHVRAVLNDTGLDPSDVILEITESVLVGGEGAAIAALDALKATGVRLAIDDFGTGYSSLAYLRRLPVELVKVDRSFISGIDAAGGDAAIVAAMVDLAHSLGLSVVAEGVETSSELEIVRQAGCDDAQGYLLGRPAGLDRLHPAIDAPAAGAALAAAS